jgi:DNA-binding XRE family transcriptional regulator
MRKIVWEVADESVREVVRLQDRARQIAYEEVESVRLKKIELSRLGHRIRRARKLLGVSQKGFATTCGLDRSYFGGVERGDRNLTFGVLCAICEGLTCDIAAVTEGIPRLPS